MAKYVDVEPMIKDLTAMKRLYDAIELDGMIKHLEEVPAADVASRAELEALISDIRAFVKQWYVEDNGFPCRFCKFSVDGHCMSEGRAKSEKVCAGQFFEWRGAKMDLEG